MMGTPFWDSWIQLFSLATNFTILLAAIKLIRHITQIEFKVNMMWEVFLRKFDDRKTVRELK